VLFLLVACGALHAQVSRYDEKQMAPASDKPPAILNGVGVAQHLNQQLPLGLTFTDDTGKQV
jgi:protein SCO1/2